MSEPTPTRQPLLPRRLLTPLAIAFGAGLLLFLLLWVNQRPDNDFFKPGPAGPAARDGDPLPAPLPADVATGGDNASGLRLPPGGQAPTPGAAVEQPRLLEPPTPPPAPRPAPVPPVASVGTPDSPLPLNRPPPVYPREALRSRAGGTVRVRATVGPNGRVERLELVQGSGNRHLDRAASEAVRRWTFRPATRDGQPVSADVIIPVSFEPPR